MNAEDAIRSKVQDLFPISSGQTVNESEERPSETTAKDDFSSIPIPSLPSDEEINESRKKVDKLVSKDNMTMMLNHLL